MGLLGKFRRKAKRRVVVVGLDGVPHPLLKSLISKGHIRNMASIFEGGYFGPMSVSIPEISSVSWSSFMTGTQSGKHGIFGFIDLEPGTYRLCFPNFAYLKAPTLWDDLAVRGMKSVVINMPATYPAREINGALISGFVAIDLNKAVYPRSLAPYLNNMGYRIDLDTQRARQDHEYLFRDLETTLSGRDRAVDFLWKEIDWDLFIVVITGTDRLMHFLWEAFEKEEHPHHKACLSYLNKVDRFVGRVYDRFLTLDGSQNGRNKFYMLSDHGFTMIKSEVYLNRWLQENGYLKFNNSEPESIMQIGPGSTAFTMDPSRVYINLKGKYPLGTVDSADYERVRHEIKQGLEELTSADGHRIAKRIFLKEELYHGPLLDQAPDLVVLSKKGYDLKGKVNSKAVFGRSDLLGMHSQDNAFFFSNSGTQCKSIFEIKRLIMESLSAENELVPL